MARHASAIKAARQSAKRQLANTAARSKIRTVIKRVRSAILSKDNKEKLSLLLNEAQSVLMKAASKQLIKKQTASRYVSRLSSQITRALGRP